MWLGRFFQVCILFMLSPLVMGFESNEHREISDLALSVAIDYRCRRDVVPQKDKCGDIIDAAEALTAKEKGLMSYGEINEVVDFMHYPGQVFDVNVYALSKESLNQHVKKLLKKSAKVYVFFDYLSASSHNERHFQADLLKSLDDLHRAAVNDARDGYIFRALVRSALSDHFLNDFFAPGHITTPRENSHDTVALAMHDWSNRAGTCFVIEDENWPELSEYLRFIEEGNYQFLDAIDDDYELANNNLQECGNTATFDVTGLNREQLQKKTIGSLTNSHDKIFLQGDGSLIRNPKQKLFMLLVQVQSILEVLDSYIDCPATPACKDQNNSTTKYEWSDTYNAAGGVVAPTAKIRYGNYEIKDDDEREKVYFFLPFLERPKYAYPAVADNAFLLSFGGQTLSHEPARFETQLELFPMKFGSASEFLRDIMAPRPSSDCKVQSRQLCNVGLAFGITHFRGDDLDSTGGQLRIIKAFPKISGQISLILRRGKYNGTNVKSWENAYGFRYDHGFSLHSFYIGYQRDYGFDSTGNFGRENVITFGWTVTFPSSRVLKLFGGYK